MNLTTTLSMAMACLVVIMSQTKLSSNIVGIVYLLFDSINFEGIHNRVST